MRDVFTARMDHPTPADLRAALARSRLYAWHVAAELRMHPGTLSTYLNERRALPPDLATRIATTIARLTEEAEQADRA
jgi:hypothetical protein